MTPSEVALDFAVRAHSCTVAHAIAGDPLPEDALELIALAMFTVCSLAGQDAKSVLESASQRVQASIQAAHAIARAKVLA